MIGLRGEHHYASKHKQYNKTGAFLQTIGVTMNRKKPFCPNSRDRKLKIWTRPKTSKMGCKTTPSTQNKVIKK